MPADPSAIDNAAMAIHDHRLAFARLLHADLDLPRFFEAADLTLSRFVPFEASCWLSLDPETLLPTSHFSDRYQVEHMLKLVSNEYLEDDFGKFADIARRPRPSEILSSSTGGDNARSARHRGFMADEGFGEGDELRAVLRDGQVVWGAVAIHRRTGTFEEREADLVADASAVLAHGIRRALLRAGIAGIAGVAAAAGREQVGLILLRGDDSIEAVTPAARRFLGDLFDSTAAENDAPLTVVSVAQVARRVGAGASDEVATARLPARSGGWLLLDASLLEDDSRVAVMISSAAESGLADMIAAAHGLSSREREVATLTLQGLSTREMATSLQVSPYTVQDHLKSIFDKVGVRSRRELAAQLFVMDVVPRMTLLGEEPIPA